MIHNKIISSFNKARSTIKLSSFIKNAVGNAKIFATNKFTSMIPKMSDFTGSAGNLLNSFVDMGLNKIGDSQAKVAAKLLKTSPFEIGNSPEEDIKLDPLGFTNIMFPADLTGSELGHYIVFFTLNNNMSDDAQYVDQDIKFLTNLGESVPTVNALGSGSPTQMAQSSLIKMRNAAYRKIGGKDNVLEQVVLDNTVTPAVPANQMITGAIALYMPPDVKVSYQAGWGADDAELAGDIAQGTKDVMNAEGWADKVQTAIKTARGAAGKYVGEATSGILEAFGGGDAFKLVTKIMGIAINPRQEMYYEGPKFRTFDYSFKFWPRNQEESEAAQKVIKMFKYHMHPQLDSSYGGRLFRVPSEFEIHYLHNDGVNTNLNKISRCALESCSVSYSPEEGNFKTFEDGAPVAYTMALTFKELEYMTKSTIFKGA